MKKMFINTLPVMVVYLSLGIAYGILMEKNGYNALWSLGTSLFVFAGAAQYALVGLLVSTISPLSVFFVILIINARHIFYGLSMLKRYEKTGFLKWYLMLGLTDETFGVLQPIQESTIEYPKSYYVYTTLLHHSYWVIGSVLGGILGSLISVEILGLDFILTALFVSVFVSQAKQSHLQKPALIGLGVSFIALLVFPSQFILISMIVMLVILVMMYRKSEVNVLEP